MRVWKLLESFLWLALSFAFILASSIIDTHSDVNLIVFMALLLLAFASLGMATGILGEAA